MRWQLAALMALTLGAQAQAAPAASDTSPRVVGLTGACLAEAVPPGGLCEVVGMATLGATGAIPVSWGLYEITGRERHGLSVLMVHDANGAPKVAASLRVPADKVDAWRADPYVVASIVERNGAHYAAMSVRGADGPSAFSVHRIDPAGWRLVDSSGLWSQVETRLTAVTGPDCYPIGGDMNWRTFGLRYDMMSDTGTCGTAFLDLGMTDGAMTITSAMAVKSETTAPPPPRRRGRR